VTEAAQAVARFRDIGGSLWLEGERLRYRLPAGSSEAMQLLEMLRRHKPEVATLLRESQRENVPLSASAATDCAHCGGERVCTCPACSLHRTSEQVPCCMCRCADHQTWVSATSAQTCWHCRGNGKCLCVICSIPGQGPGWIAGPCAACHGKGMRQEVIQ